MTRQAHPALARLQGAAVSVADKTRAIQQAAATPAPSAPAPEAVAKRELTPRTITFRAEYENPETGSIEVVELTSTVPSGDEHARMARTAVAFAGGTPLDMFSAEDRIYFQWLGRAFVQIRDPSDRARELLVEPDFLGPVVGRLVEHERRFQLRGRTPSDAATLKPFVVVHAPWGPDKPPAAQ